MSDRKNILDLFEEQKTQWETRAADGIERYRKGNAQLTIVDAGGNAVPNARVKVTQKSHEFRFGANLFLLDELETPEKNAVYKQRFAEVFNMATLPFYWEPLEPIRGKPRYAKDSPKIYRRPAPDLCIEFCQAHGIEPREHALAYESFFPKWLYDADIPQIKAELARRFSEIALRYADKIPTIEVTNEMEWAKGKTAFYDAADYVEWCFRLAEKYFPNNQLGINEHTGLAWTDRCRATDKYYAYIEANLLKGARIDAIGMQYHLFHRAEDLYDRTRLTLNPDNLYRHMDLYANFGKPLQITEITVPAYSWEPEDEQLQAEVIEKLYTLWFSHPNVEQIIYWNLVDGYAHVWDPDPAVIKASQGNMALGENYYYGGLLRFDLTPKPAFETIRRLTRNVWNTRAQLCTDAAGTACFRGFYGDYTLEITAGATVITRDFTLSSKTASDAVIVI